MKVLVSGSHGLIGRALVHSLKGDGQDVHRLVRSAAKLGSPEVEWDPVRGSVDTQQLERFYAVIHLAGENIAGRWTAEKKRRIRDSRVNGTRLLSEALASLSHPPEVMLCASAIGYYGNRGEELLNESSSPGKDFLAQVCVNWERAAEPAAKKGIRVVNLRFGVILNADDGALARMLTPFRMGVGGRVGSGKQWMSWVALDDVVRMIKLGLVNEALSGPANVVSPNPVTNAEFTKTLGRALNRPTLFPIPEFGARLAFGEMADSLLLTSQRVEPRQAKAFGYQFEFPELAGALAHILATHK